MLEPGLISFFGNEGRRKKEGRVHTGKAGAWQALRFPEAGPAHFMLSGKPYAKGRYKVVDVFDAKEGKAHFNGFARMR